ncbi:MAG: Rieske 2Fe-2S domain-containing protein [Acidobacteria bacterium]|nr:Rieske 2Fe-2S domain-containing protein [Acidobacteriota bacterium]
MASATEWFDVASSDEIAEGDVRTYAAGATRVVVARADGSLYAVQDRCSHDDGPLGEGCLEGFAVQCPRHGARFDVRTGGVLTAPAVVGIGTFEIRETDGRVQVAAPAIDADEAW